MYAGMSAGVPKYITINLSTLGAKFSDGDEVSLESLTQKRMLNLSGKEAKLPLKVQQGQSIFPCISCRVAACICPGHCSSCCRYQSSLVVWPGMAPMCSCYVRHL